jgi:hypothetical protein
MDLKQIELYRLMSPSQKLRIALRLYYSAWQLKEAGLRLHHPDWTEMNFRKKQKKSFYMPEADLFFSFSIECAKIQNIKKDRRGYMDDYSRKDPLLKCLKEA